MWLKSSLNCEAFPSFGKQTGLCCLSGKLLFRGNCTRKRVLQKVQRVCGVELTCIKKVFLHLKYPAGREPDCTKLHTLSSRLNKDLRRVGCWGGSGVCPLLREWMYGVKRYRKLDIYRYRGNFRWWFIKLLFFPLSGLCIFVGLSSWANVSFHSLVCPFLLSISLLWSDRVMKMCL